MKRIALIAALAALIALPACGSLSGDVAGVRVTEYGVSGIFTGSAVGGCEVQQSEGASSAAGKSSMSVTLIYRGEKCAVNVAPR